MSAPRFADCRCTHGKESHETEGFAPQCTAPHCNCLRYVATTGAVARPSTAPAVLRPVAAVVPAHREPPVSMQGERPPTIEQILQAGKRSEFKRSVQLAEKIGLLIHDLRGRLADEREAAEAKRHADAAAERIKAEIAALEAQLAARRADLRGNPMPRTPGGSTQGGKEDCPTCGLPFANLGAHRFKKHGYRKVAS